MSVHSREQAPFGVALPHAPHVPSSWFLTTSTVYSTLWCTGLLHPVAGPGFATFPADADRRKSRRTTALDHGAFPATRFTPFEELPSSTAVAASLRPVAFVSLLDHSTVEGGRSCT